MRIAVTKSVRLALEAAHQTSGGAVRAIDVLVALAGTTGALSKALGELRCDQQQLVAASGKRAYATPPGANMIDRIVTRANIIARDYHQTVVHSGHVLLALFAFSETADVFREVGLRERDLAAYLPNMREDEEALPANGGEGPDSGKSMLEQFTLHLNAEAAEGRIDPMVGRLNELQNMIHVLARRRKANPVLVGDAGVGKTAVVEGLALAIHEGRVPDAIKDMQIYAVDLTGMVAGTKFRGEFEERLKRLINEVEGDKNKVLFIDEIHMLVGAGATGSSSMDASNILKPALARGRVRCVGATTSEEFQKHIEKDAALTRRFHRIDVGEPSVSETTEILKGLRASYHKFHGVDATDEALARAATLAARYMHDKRLPDKAIDVVDMAMAKAKLDGQDRIEIHDVEVTVAKLTGVPLGSLSVDGMARLASLETEIRSQVFGQDEAAKGLARAVKIHRAGIGSAKPIGAFLFTGPTGVGKTETAKALARALNVPFLRFDMSEYHEGHTSSRLVGAPPGYVGFERPGLLTEAVRRNPYAVILLDEIEKAHPDVHNLLLQVMDAGVLTDAMGRTADFRNVMVIMTSNVGAREAAARKVGFESTTKGEDARYMSFAFSPEFRNRLSGVVKFNPITPDILRNIVDKFVDKLARDLAEKNVVLTVTDAAREALSVLGYDPAMGARPLERVLDERIKAEIVDDLLFGCLTNGGQVYVDHTDGDFSVGCMGLAPVMPVEA